MPAALPPIVDHAAELLAPLGPVRVRRMFGGHGLYADGLFIALIAADTLYLKADEQARPAFEQAGCQPFAFETQGGRRVVLGYWSAPEQAMDSPAGMAPWARLALASALRAAASKAAPAQRKPRAKPDQAPAKAKAPEKPPAKPRRPAR